MKKKLVCLLLFFVTFHASADVIQLSSDPWCPYACEDSSKDPGFMVEIAKAVFEPAGHTIIYKNVNWARAVSESREGKITGIVGAAKGDVPEFVFPSVPIGYSSNFIWTTKEKKWNYSGIKSLGGKKIAVINAYSYGDEVDHLVQKKNPSIVVLSGNDALMKMVKMADAKRIDGFVENPYVLSWKLKDEVHPYQFKPVSKNLANDPDLFIAFSPANPKSKMYAQLLSDGMVKLRKSGKLKQILSKYGVEDWVK